MINNSLSVWLGITFVAVGAINVWLILQASAKVKTTKASAPLIAAHRIGGYLFIALFCVMGYFMVARLGDVSGSAPTSTMIHLTLAMVLSPLLFVKVLIARYYKSYYSVLMPIGLTIFVLSFVLIGITAGPSLAHQARMQTVSLASIDLPPADIDLNMAAKRMEERCSKCHNLDRIAGAHKDARGWLTTVNRMRALPDSGISADDSRIIISYLASQMGPKGSPAAANLEVGRALVDQHCGRCHSLDRVYKTAQTPEEWRATVDRMVAFAEGSANAFHPGEDEQIVTYLSTTQTPEAVSERKTQVAAASSAGRSMVTQKSPVSEETTPSTDRDTKALGFIAIVGLSVVVLAVRRPARPVASPAMAGTPAGAVPAQAVRPTGSPTSDSLILKLASIRQQTSDAKTLRFVVPEGRTLNSRPGQFLTFSFLFDGKKVVRSYSICSSAARSGYIEITPKRIQNGCASVFLNDRAAVGMTVEAAGPFGQFCLDERRHRSVVLLAAGSGITPMMAMLRYIDDLCLDTTATLLYCVRTNTDIIFERELEQLQSRLQNFQYHVMLSQPHAQWAGSRGHLSREFIERTIKDINSHDFFLCGPPAFMDAGRNILMGLGVKPERIMQESFGAPAPARAPTPALSETGAVVEFVRSAKTGTIRKSQTLLETAEETGVAIPFSCRQGQCGTCKTKLLAGNVQMDAEQGLDDDSRAQGFVLTCVGRADGDVQLDA
jgi:ferredoxin-NADP reductase/mono/diheme cytochrome c family protein